MKRVLWVVVGLLVGVTAFFAGSALADQPVKIYVNGTEVISNPTAIIVDNYTMVPLRVISEALRAEVVWDAQTNSVLISTTPKTPLLKINGELTTWPYWVRDGKLYLERRNAIQLIREGLRHPEHSIAYFSGDRTLVINGKSIPLPLLTEGDYQIVNVEYLRDLGIVNFEWDAQEENLVILPR